MYGGNNNDDDHFKTPAQHEVYRHAKAGNIEKVRYWIEEQNYPIYKTDFYFNSLLYYACLCNHPPLVAYLIERGAIYNPIEYGDRIFLASANPEIRNILLGKQYVGEKPVFVDSWYSSIFQKSEYSDVCFNVDGKSIPAHKCILAARCPQLIPKLQKQDAILMGTSISEHLMTTFLEYAYSDKAKIEQHHKNVLFHMAKKLNFKGLKEFCLNSNAYSTIAEDMNTMYNNPLFSDVVLVTDDGSVFAHKVILVTRSEYFKTMFSPKWTESGSTEFRVGHISFDVLSVIIKYLYTGVIKVTEQFLIRRLKQELEVEALRSYLDVENCVELATVATSLRIIYNNSKSLSESIANLPENIKQDLIKSYRSYNKNDI